MPEAVAVPRTSTLAKPAPQRDHGLLDTGTPDFAEDSLQRALDNPTRQTLTPGVVLQLQRRFGNQVTQALIRQSADPKATVPKTAVQRYTDASAAATEEGRDEEIVKWAQKFQRTSANRGIAQVSEKKLYARDDIIDAGEASLAAQGSFVQLVKEAGDITGYSLVKVKFRESKALPASKIEDLKALNTESGKTADARKEKQVEVIDALTARNNVNIAADDSSAVIKSGSKDANASMEKEKAELVKMVHPGANDMFMTIRDCHKTARLIMGDFGAGKQEKILFSDADGTLKKVVPGRDDKAIYATVGQQGAVAFLKFAFKNFGAVLARQVPRNMALEARVAEQGDAFVYTKAMAVYGDIQADSVIGPLFNRTFKVNDEAQVAVGQALVQVNDENERAASVAGTLPDGKGGNKDLWNFHWAGVILMDGADYVTLQAVADQMASDLTVNWWFKMYGAGGQSFHAEEKNDPHVGSRPLTLSVATEAPAAAKKIQMPTRPVD